MTDVEKRRIALLRDTRKNYSEKYTPPAIHPRYQSTYQALYGTEESKDLSKSGGFFLRLLLSMIIFGMFFIMDYRKEEFGAINSQTVIQTIQKSFGK